MAQAWDAELREGVPESEGCLIVDNGWDHGRNGSTGVMPIMSATTGRIVEMELSRRNDPGANSSQSLERRNFMKFLHHPLTMMKQYADVSMDGAQPLIAAARKAGLGCQGDPWHSTRNRGKHFKGHVDVYMPREQPSIDEKAARAAEKPDRPPPIGAPAAKLGKPAAEEPRPSLEQMRSTLRAAAEPLPAAPETLPDELPDLGKVEEEVSALYEALRNVTHTKAALAKLGCSLSPCIADLPLGAYAKQLASVHAVCARQAAMTSDEKSAWVKFDEYCLLQARADAARAARTARNKLLKQARLQAVAWERNLRSLYNHLFAYAAAAPRSPTRTPILASRFRTPIAESPLSPGCA